MSKHITALVLLATVAACAEAGSLEEPMLEARPLRPPASSAALADPAPLRAPSAAAPPRRLTREWTRSFPGADGAERDMLAVDSFGRAHLLLVNWYFTPDVGEDNTPEYHPESFEWQVVAPSGDAHGRDPEVYFQGRCYYGLHAVHDDVILAGSGHGTGLGFEAPTLARVSPDGSDAAIAFEPRYTRHHITCSGHETVQVEVEGSWAIARDTTGVYNGLDASVARYAVPAPGGIDRNRVVSEPSYTDLERFGQVMADGSFVVVDTEAQRLRWISLLGNEHWSANGQWEGATATPDGHVYGLRGSSDGSKTVVIFDANGVERHAVSVGGVTEIHVDPYDRGLVAIGGTLGGGLRVVKVGLDGAIRWETSLPHQWLRSIQAIDGTIYLAGAMGLRNGWFAAIESANGTLLALDTVSTHSPRSWPPGWDLPPLESMDSYSPLSIDAQVEASPDGTAVYAAFSSTGGTKLVRYVADRDEDGIPDRWEEDDCIPYGGGCFYIGDRYDLDPDHKDILVELDMMERPASQTWTWTAALQKVRQAFAAAPVHNPDGRTGINLHLDDREQNLPRAAWSSAPPVGQGFPELEAFKQESFGRVGDGSYEREALGRIVRYGVIADVLTEDPDIGGIAEFEGNDFILFPRSQSFAARRAQVDTLPAAERVDAWNRWLAAELMHELGHTLGLDHGGGFGVSDDEREIHRKPNYHSVMNYMWIQPATPMWPFLTPDYSTGRNHSIEETLFDERLGFGGTAGHESHRIAAASYLPDEDGRFLQIVESESGPFDANGDLAIATAEPVDWDNDGDCDSEWECGKECGYDVNGDNRCTTLHDHDDWGFLSFRLSSGVGWSDGWSQSYGMQQREIAAMAEAAEIERQRCEQPHGPGTFCPCPADGAQQPCGIEEGVCVAGAQTCVQGQWTECVGDVPPGFEVCDGLDNDCNGTADDGFDAPPGACTVGVGACARAGTPVCTGAGGVIICTGEPGPPAPEVCGDGIDDDCDGVADDGCVTLLRPLPGTATGSPHTAGATMAVHPLRPAFAWTPVAGATSYQFEATPSCTAVASCDFSFVTLSAFPAEPGITFSHDLPVSLSVPVGTRYTWRVRACNASGCGSWSAPSYVDVGRQRDDFDGDGYGDLVASLSQQRVYIYRGSPTGIDASSRRLRAQAGTHVVAAGDINGDGYADAVYGYPTLGRLQGNVLSPSFGMVDIAFGSSAGLDTPGVSPARRRFDGHYMNGGFGHSVAYAGDVDVDGYADLFVGQPGYGDIGEHLWGRVTLLFGGASYASMRTVVHEPAGLPVLADFGQGVAAGGDVDGDGALDLVAIEGDAALVHVLRYDAASETLAVTSTVGLAPGEHAHGFARALVLGDLNGDRHADLVVSDYGYAPHPEQLHVWYGAAGGFTGHVVVLDPSGQSSSSWGLELALADYDANGFADLAVGSPRYDRAGIADDVGRRVFLRGSATGLLLGLSRTSPYLSQTHYGWTVGWVDGNGDGYPESVVGAPGLDTTLTDVGAVLVSTLDPQNGNVVSTQYLEGTLAGGGLGADVD